jgi:hypothetical protein
MRNSHARIGTARSSYRPELRERLPVAGLRAEDQSRGAEVLKHVLAEIEAFNEHHAVGIRSRPPRQVTGRRHRDLGGPALGHLPPVGVAHPSTLTGRPLRAPVRPRNEAALVAAAGSIRRRSRTTSMPSASP